MMSKLRRKHVLLSIPVLASVLLYIHCFVLRSFVTGIADLKIGDLYAYPVIVLSFVMLIIHKIWFRPEYKGSFRMDLMKEKSVVLPLIVYLAIDLGYIIVGWITDGVQLPSAELLGLVLMAGIGEEVCYRVISMTTELRISIRKDSYFPALAIASLVFGLGHLMNLFSGAVLGRILLQVCATTVAGFMMGALFLRTGNILYPMIVHVLHDLFAVMTVGALAANSNALTIEAVAYQSALMLVQIIITWWLLKGRKEEILAVWKERWSVKTE